jgi:hypothetical protein
MPIGNEALRGGMRRKVRQNIIDTIYSPSLPAGVKDYAGQKCKGKRRLRT